MDKIGRYEIEKELGQGGMAKVYIAYDPNVKRKIALKVMSGQLIKEEEYRARFKREAEAVAKLEHVGIVPIYDFGEDGENLFIVMRLMNGGTLTDRIQKGPIDVYQSVKILRRIAMALDKAHENGIVHRDLKPGNILFDEDGEAYIADFGVAHLATSETLTGAGALIGTPSYMSPEQVMGKTDKLDGRSDIYSIGVILFEMLTGSVPYSSDTPIGIALMHINDPVPRVLESNPDLPPTLQQIIDKAMAKEAEDRYGTASDMVDALDGAIVTSHQLTEPIRSISGEKAKPAAKPKKRSSLPLVAFIGVAVLAVAAFFLRGAFSGQQGDSAATQTALALAAVTQSLPDTPLPATEPPTEPPTDATEPPATEAPIEPSVLHTSPFSGSNLIQIDSLAVLGGGRANDLAASPDNTTLAVAGSLGLYIYDLQTLELSASYERGVVFTSVAWSPNGGQVVLGGQDGSVRVWSTTNGQELLNIDAHDEPVNAVGWSPDGTTLASASDDNNVRLWDAAGGRRLANLTGHTEDATALAWSPDGSQFISAAWQVWGWNLSGFFSTYHITGHRNQINALAWSPDGSQFISASSDASLKVWAAANGELIQDLAGQTEPVLAVAWSSEGDLIAESSGNDVRLRDAAGFQVVAVLSGHTGMVTEVAWVNGAAQLVSLSANGEIRLWDAASATQIAENTADHSAAVGSALVLPGGEHAVTGAADGTLRLWNIATGEVVSANKEHTGAVTSMALSPDGLLYATGSADSTIRIWDSTTGEAVRVLSGHTGPVNAVSWSPDGLYLASAGQDASVKIWDGQTGSQVSSFGQGEPVASVSWSPDSQHVAFASGDDVVIREALTGLTVTTLSGNDGILNAVAWSPAGDLIAAAGEAGLISVWRPSGSEARAAISAHQGVILGLTWSHDGSLLFSAGSDGTFRIFNAAAGTELSSLSGHMEAVNAVALLEDLFIISAGEDGTARVWGIPAAAP